MNREGEHAVMARLATGYSAEERAVAEQAFARWAAASDPDWCAFERGLWIAGFLAGRQFEQAAAAGGTNPKGTGV
jgi:hypothetical protein